MNETKITTLKGFERKQAKVDNLNQMFDEAVEFVRSHVAKRLEQQRVIDALNYSNSIDDMVA